MAHNPYHHIEQPGRAHSREYRPNVGFTNPYPDLTWTHYEASETRAFPYLKPVLLVWLADFLLFPLAWKWVEISPSPMSATSYVGDVLTLVNAAFCLGSVVAIIISAFVGLFVLITDFTESWI